jgi:hypothetical protein
MGATWRRTRRLILWPAVLVVAAAGGYLATVGIARERPRTLPAPTGPYLVGREQRQWTDTARVDPLAPQPGQPRVLAVWLWYPAAAGTSAPAPYAPGPWTNLRQQGFFAGPLERIRTQTFDDAPAADGQFPLVVLEPGLGLSAPQFTTLAQDLASNGFVVAGITPTYSANVTVINGHVVERTQQGNPDNVTDAAMDALVEVWAADARFVAGSVASLVGSDRLGGHFRPGVVTYVGHSLGGAASLQACHDDASCFGAVDLDGTPYGRVGSSGLDKPFLLITSQGGCQERQCQNLLSAASASHWQYAVQGAQHFNFTDYGVYFLAPPLQNLLGQLGSINGTRCLEITAAAVVTFLDHVLRSGPTPDGLVQHYPELQ